MMNKYRKTEAKRIEFDRQLRSKAEKEARTLEGEKKKILEMRKRNEEKLTEIEKKLTECKMTAKAQKEERRMVVERYIDTIVDSMKMTGTTTPDIERELSRRKFQIRTKIEEFWKKMDLYENCLLGIEMEKRSHKTENGNEANGNKLQRSDSIKATESSANLESCKEQKKILEELLLRHREAYVANENKLRHIDNAMESCKAKYEARLEQSNLLLKELKDQKALTSNLIDKEQATEDSRLRSDSELVHTLRYVSSVSSPLHLEQEISKNSSGNDAIFNYNENAFEEIPVKSYQETGHKSVIRTPSKTEKLEIRKEKYESLIRDAERSIVELKNARALELGQYNMEKTETEELSGKIKMRIENDRTSLLKVAEESKIVAQKEENSSDTQRKQLLESRLKIVELFEKSLLGSLNDATIEIKELHRTGWGGFSLSRARKHSDINDFLSCVMRSVEIYNLDEIADSEAGLSTVKDDLVESDTKLKEIENKEISLQNVLLQQIEKRKIRSDLARVKHYQEISRSVEQLLTIAEGKNPSHVTAHLSKEAQHLAKSREKLEELENS